MKLYFACLFLLLCPHHTHAQSVAAYADSIRAAYHIPELGIAVVSHDKVLMAEVLGRTRINNGSPAEHNDRFRIGSNTKTITAFIAAQLVHSGRLRWDTRFFDLYPSLKAHSNKAYYNITLLQLLSFRTRLPHYTYTDTLPHPGNFTGSGSEQRYQFMQWALQQQPVALRHGMGFSNPGYVAAGLMLEQATGKPYAQLVAELGAQLGIGFQLGTPNTADTLQPWGHNEALQPEPPAINEKLEWLQAAGNINVSLHGYARFIQLQLSGLAGGSDILTAAEFNFLHFGLPAFAVGWFWQGAGKERYSYHTGNPGTFLSQVFVDPAADRGYLLFANVQSEQAEQGMALIYEEMKRRYSH